MKIYQKLSVGHFKWKQIFQNLIKSFHILEVDIKYPKYLHNLLDHLPFLPERMKIKKCNKLVCSMYDKNNYAVYIRTLKQPLNHGLVLTKVKKVI